MRNRFSHEQALPIRSANDLRRISLYFIRKRNEAEDELRKAATEVQSIYEAETVKQRPLERARKRMRLAKAEVAVHEDSRRFVHGVERELRGVPIKTHKEYIYRLGPYLGHAVEALFAQMHENPAVATATEGDE